MKKVLFATTALIATAGVAAADVSLSGSAEMGFSGGDTISNSTGVRTLGVTGMHQDIDVTFKMSGETDSGLTFSAAVDLDETASNVGADDAGVAISISGAFGTITMGDTDGGFDWGMGEVPTGSGSVADNETGHSGWNGNGGLDNTATLNPNQVLSYTNTVGTVGFALSVELDDTVGATQMDPIVGVGLRYAAPVGAAPLNIGVGYQTSSTAANIDTEVMGVSFGTTIAGLNVGVNFSEQTVDGNSADQTHTAIGIAYSEGAMSFGVNYGEYENRGNVANTDTSGFGVSAGYNLGGGASLRAGYGSSDVSVGGVKTSADNWSVGLAMSF